jgi:hypothetical protein
MAGNHSDVLTTPTSTLAGRHVFSYAHVLHQMLKHRTANVDKCVTTAATEAVIDGRVG